MMLANQQVKFKDMFPIDTTNYKKLNKMYSLQLLITELKANFVWYDLLPGFNILKYINFVTEKMRWSFYSWRC